jgi:hypothetical protein
MRLVSRLPTFCLVQSQATWEPADDLLKIEKFIDYLKLVRLSFVSTHDPATS